MLNVVDLTFSYSQQRLFDRWSHDFRGGLNWVCGHEGQGKTSLLRLLSGQQAAQSGLLQLDGVGLALDPNKYKGQTFWIDPRTEQFDQLTVLDYWKTVYQNYPQFDHASQQRYRVAFGLEPHLHKQLFMLSSGSKRKVWLTAAFASNAVLTLIDDPFAALDQPSTQAVLQAFKALANQSQRVVIAADYEMPPVLADLAALVTL
jgi:ABC-type multidrug transport system ATPase subunit